MRDSTHKMTALTFSNYYPGYTLPLAECASGKIWSGIWVRYNGPIERFRKVWATRDLPVRCRRRLTSHQPRRILTR